MLNHSDLLQFFESVLDGDTETIHRIDHGPAEARIEHRHFIFSIAALLEILDPQGKTGMKAFRRLLYTSELNRELGARGAEISVFHSSGKVDSNTYCLKATC